MVAADSRDHRKLQIKIMTARQSKLVKVQMFLIEQNMLAVSGCIFKRPLPRANALDTHPEWITSLALVRDWRPLKECGRVFSIKAMQHVWMQSRVTIGSMTEDAIT